MPDDFIPNSLSSASPPDALDLFPTGSYDTPPGTRRALLDRLLLGSGIFFHLVTWRIVIGGSFRASTGAYSPWHWQRDSLSFLRGVEACGAKVHVRGLNNVRDPGRPVVFIANHMSALETWVICCMILSKKRRTTFVVKESLLRFPFFKHFLLACSAIPVTRKSPSEDLKAVFTLGAERLASGISVVIFPQSTRSPIFNPAEFNSLGVKLAKRAGVPVIPVAIKTDFLGVGKVLKEFGPVYRGRDVWFEFGEETQVSGNGREEHQRITDFISERLRSWGMSVAGDSDAT